MKRKHGPKGKKKRDEIIEIAANSINRKGYKGTSLQDVCDDAAIHKSTFFHYFDNKFELLVAAIKEPIDEMEDLIEQILKDPHLLPEEKLKKAIAIHIKMLSKYTNKINIFTMEYRHLSTSEKEKFISERKHYSSCFIQIVKEMQNEMGRFKELDPKIVAYGILGMCNWFGLWYKQDGSLKTEEISEIFYKMLTPR